MPDLIRRAKKREAEAVDVLDMVVRAIGDTIQILAQSVDPRLIILGGGMAKTGEPLVEVITAELRRRESQCRFLETIKTTHLKHKLKQFHKQTQFKTV